MYVPSLKQGVEKAHDDNPLVNNAIDSISVKSISSHDQYLKKQEMVVRFLRILVEHMN